MSAEREQLRQRLLLRTLWRQAGSHALNGWLRPLHSGVQAQRGIAAYRANAGAVIERALAASFPTVCSLVSEESFAALARAYWHAHPPLHGDLALAGEQLPAFIAASESLADVPYLADVAQLDAAVDAAERAADAQWQPHTLALLGSSDPAHLRIDLLPGSALLSSTYPIVTIRDAHQRSGDDRFDAAREALAAGRGEHAFVWRDGYRAEVTALDDADAHWMQLLLRGDSLARALDEAHADFDFQRWLVAALQRGWLARITLMELQP